MTETPSSSTYIPPWRRRQNLPEENNDTITRQSSSQNVRAISDNVPQRLKTSFSKPQDITSSRRVKTPRLRRNITYTFKKLKELTEKDPKTIFLEITSRRNEFEELIGTDLTDDALVLVVKTLALVCTVDMVECKAAIMNLALKDGFHNSLRKFLLNLILHDSTDRKDSSYFWEDPARFFTDVAMVLQTLIETVPTKSGEVLPKTLVACTSSLELIFKEDPNPELLTMFDKLKKNLELCKTQVVKKTSRKRSDYYEVEPSDDFRDLSVYPTSSEVLSDQGYLRKHLIDRGYQNVHHYLDVQFRLLKEDFVGPLRDGIAEYMQYRGPNRSIIKASNVRIYTHVEFLKPIWSNGQVGVLLQFENSLWTSKVKFNFHKRFMYGSLLCFTRDNFRSLSFGKVIDSNSQLLQKRQVVVEFEQYVVGQPYIMVECSVFFEPYYQVLTALQDIDEEQFPMAKYIIHLDPTINIPSYLRGNNEIEANDLSQLNDSQYQAICDGLTKEFVVIQGPPGTGKTYLGLEMVKSLIKNKVLWYRAGPILIVCYTNHALDQFLEGLITTTYEIVRVGGRSRNINLNRFTLKEQRRRSRTQNYHRKAFYDIGDQVYSCLKSIDSYSNILKDIDSNSVLISFHQLLIFDEDGFFYLFENFTVEEEILWLLDDVSKKQERPQIHQEENVQEDDELTKEFEEIEFNQMRNKHLTDDYFWDDRTRESEEHILTSVSQLKSKIKKLQLKERQGKNVDVDKIHNELIKLEGLLNRLKMNLKKYANVRVDKKPELKSPYSMSIDERWYFYLYFVEKYKETLNCRLIETQNKYLSIINQYNELKDVVDFEIMKNSLVVGMTTTAAARLQSVIKNLKCPIVIVEEAAEVLESHVVISLTPHCQHLILIGDHQQLKPSTSNFYIERQCNLGVSLFERMIRNNIRCHVLDVQHRMRPEIANLIVPAIYPKLENHPSVYEFPPVLGVGTNLYFIDHEYEEEESGDSSKLNMHETKFFFRTFFPKNFQCG
ncbi:hypothetical protein FQR65_LT12272 [Abscondita terminalis]|nr:hypothetical protein FQR65_LT12272 [Abscondita terminalis]